MKTVYLFICVATAYIASAVPVSDDGLGAKTYPRFVDFPDGDGNMHKVDLEAEPNMEALEEILKNPANNLYLLFTRANPTAAQTLVMNNAASVINSNFNPNVPTKVLVHGGFSNQNSEPNFTVRHAFLRHSNVNVIVVDWSRLAALDYITQIVGIPAIGQGLGQFLQFLNSATGARIDQMHLVGFSQGAHVIGSAGRTLGGNVARITGLDPAGPLWLTNVNRLNPNDGVYVEAIHTDGGLTGVGIGTAIANADFFPNGGALQPGCLPISIVCNHDRAWELFAASIDFNNLIGRQCANTLQISLNTCTGSELHMGNAILTKRGSGMFRINTSGTHPFVM